MNAPFSSFCAGVLISALCVIFVSCDEKSQTVDEKPPLVDEKPQTVQVSNIELAATLSLEVGEKQTLTATILPADAENRTVSWISGDENIAEVSSSGEVTAAGAGATIIIATAVNGRTASCTVIVTAKTEQELQGTFPVTDIPEEVTAFFNENIHWIGRAALEPNNKHLIDSCVMINSVEELPKVKIDDNLLKFPVIDFDSYTLVVGSYVIRNGAVFLTSQSIVVSHDIATINLILDYKRDMGGSAAIEPRYFWGLYPKIAVKSINMNITQPSWNIK